MSKILTKVSFRDTLNTGIKVIRIDFEKEYTKLDLGFLYSEERENIIKISDKIILYDHLEKRKLIECMGININEEIELKSVKDFRYFSLKFEAVEGLPEDMLLVQNNKPFSIVIMDIKMIKTP